MNHKLIKRGFILAGLMNCSVLVFSKGFTNTAINAADPVVMSNFGLFMIVVWGLAYIAGSTAMSQIKWLAGVFALEKLIYSVVWARWQANNSLSAVYSEDFLAGVFYSIYGINDFLFMIFFAYVFFVSKSCVKED
jgi:Zn-dependent protease with chaperone function